MKIYDLSHPLQNGMPFYPGTEAPSFEPAFTLEQHGFRETRLSLLSHTGTHIDAPAHILKGGKTLSNIDIQQFTGVAFILDVSDVQTYITESCLKPLHTLDVRPDIILFFTDKSSLWGQESYFTDYPVPDETCARRLADMKLKAVGFDTISADKANSSDLPNHHIFLEKEILIIENLNIPTEIVGKLVRFHAFPLKLAKGDGAPVRAVAEI